MLHLMDKTCVQQNLTSGLLTTLCRKQNAYLSMQALLPDAAHSIHIHVCSIRLDTTTVLVMLEYPCVLDCAFRVLMQYFFKLIQRLICFGSLTCMCCMQEDQPAPPKLNLNQYMPQHFREDSPRSPTSDHSSASAHAGPATPDIRPPLLPSRNGRQPAALPAARHAGISSPSIDAVPNSVSAVAEAMRGTYAARMNPSPQQLVPDMIQLLASAKLTAEMRPPVDVGAPVDVRAAAGVGPPADMRAPVASGPANKVTTTAVTGSCLARARTSVQSVVPDTVQFISGTAQAAAGEAGHNTGSAEVEQHRSYNEEQDGAQESCGVGRTADSRVLQLEDDLLCCPLSLVSVSNMHDLKPWKGLHALTSDTLMTRAQDAVQPNLSAPPGVLLC